MSKRWCFTVNLTTNPQWRPVRDTATTDYLIWERETAPTTGQIHIQGYLRLKKRTRINTVKTILGRRDAHLEPANGSEQDNIDYCTKERINHDDWAEDGEPDLTLRQGRRSDLEEVRDAILKGQSLRQVAMDHSASWIRYHGGITSFYRLVEQPAPLSRPVKVMVLWGPTGVGKTHRILTNFPETLVISAGRDPFGSYENQQTILFDEFVWDAWPIEQMNRYLDKWRCKLDCRYQDKYAKWSTVFICSNSNPASWYSSTFDELRQAFFRRINEIIYVQNKEQVINFE